MNQFKPIFLGTAGNTEMANLKRAVDTQKVFPSQSHYSASSC